MREENVNGLRVDGRIGAYVWCRGYGIEWRLGGTPLGDSTGSMLRLSCIRSNVYRYRSIDVPMLLATA